MRCGAPTRGGRCPRALARVGLDDDGGRRHEPIRLNQFSPRKDNAPVVRGSPLRTGKLTRPRRRRTGASRIMCHGPGIMSLTVVDACHSLLASVGSVSYLYCLGSRPMSRSLTAAVDSRQDERATPFIEMIVIVFAFSFVSGVLAHDSSRTNVQTEACITLTQIYGTAALSEKGENQTN